jgi:uncharacterized membrane protein YfcA
MEYLAFVLWCFGVAAAGGLVGLVLGNLRLPATLVFASSAAAGTGANLVISAVAALTASIAHVRAGRVNWRLFAWMAPPSIAGALIGGYLSGAMPRRALLAFITLVLLYSASELWRRTPRAPRPAPATGEAPAPEQLDIPAAVGAGAAIGLLGGIVGLILGSLRMPALLKMVGEAPARAAGTNVTVGVCVGIAGALGHLPSAAPDWTVAAIGSAASIPGALVGSRLTGRLSEPQLVRAIAVVLLVAAAGTAAQAVA